MTTTYTSGSQLLSWSLRGADAAHQATLEQIHAWWMTLQGQTILWQVFLEPIHLTPLISYYCQVKQARSSSIVFDWCREGATTWNTFTAKELKLDIQKKELEIVPHSFSSYRYQLTVIDSATFSPEI